MQKSVYILIIKYMEDNMAKVAAEGRSDNWGEVVTR